MAQGKKRDNKISDQDIKSMREYLYDTLRTLLAIEPEDVKKLSAKTKLELASKVFPYVIPKADMNTLKDDRLARALDGVGVEEMESILNPKKKTTETVKTKAKQAKR